MVKQFYYILGTILIHYIFGWIPAVCLTAIVAAVVFEEHMVTKASTLGLLVNAAGVVYTMIVFEQQSWQMMVIMDEYVSDFSPYIIPIISIGLPTLMYGLAAYFSSNVLYVYRKINASEPIQNNSNRYLY